MPNPTVLSPPEAALRLRRGFEQLAQVLAVTLGPTQGAVMAYTPVSHQLETLTDAATIARRVMQLPDRGEDVGAMILRNLVWRVHTRVGDGCATTAVLARALLTEAHRAVAAGANPMTLRAGIDRAARVALDALLTQARPVAGEHDLYRVAQAITGEPDLSFVAAEMLSILGADAHITIEDYVAPYLEREYLEGGRWQGQLASRVFFTDSVVKRAVRASTLVVLFAGDVTEVAQVRPLLELMARTEQPRLALFAHAIKGAALDTLIANQRRDDIDLVPVALRRAGAQRRADFDDLAVLTGARVLAPEMGTSLERIAPDDVGFAKRIEAGTEDVVVVGAVARDDVARRDQIATLRARLERLPVTETDARDELRFRIARLVGSTGVLKVGAFTKPERAFKRQLAEKALRAVPLALREGVVPGGGVAFLACVPAVRALEAEPGEAAWGREIVARVLEAPFRQIVRNAGKAEPGAVLAEARHRGPGFGYDAVANAIVNLDTAGVLDPVSILRTALQTAVSGAMMALSTEVVVLKRKPRVSLEP